jgi:hypothetical protein
MIPMIDKTVGLDNKRVAFYHLGNYTEFTMIGFLHNMTKEILLRR